MSDVKTTPGERLVHLMRMRHRCICMATMEESFALEMVRDAAMSLGKMMRIWTAVDGVRDGLIEGAAGQAQTETAAAGLFAMARDQKADVCVCLDAAAHLRSDPRTERACRDLIERVGGRGGHVVLIDCESDLPGSISAEATPLEIPLPDEDEIEMLVRRAVQRVNRDTPVRARVTTSDLRRFVRALGGLTRRQVEQVVTEAVLRDGRFDPDDLDLVLERKRSMMSNSGVLQFVNTPADLSEVAGLRRLKAWLKRREEALSDEARAFGIDPPRGVLMLGVQGTGKSLCARAIATAWRRPLLRLDPGTLYDRYVGESEQRLRHALRQAEALAPCVLWIDEIEKGFASAASQSTDGGLSQRMFGSLLTWMQEHRAPVFLVATANNIDALPPELLRKGRFDAIFFVDLPSEEVRREIFAIHLRKRKRDPVGLGLDMDALGKVSEGFSAAEIEQVVVSALHEAYATRGEVTTEMLIRSVEGSPPLSVTAAERVAALRDWAVGRCVPAD